MPSRENLFQLIKLLTRDERKFFLKYLDRYEGSDSAYVSLFKDLDRAKSYSAEKLEKKYKSYRVLISKLKRRLLDAMRQMEIEEDIDNQIFCQMQDFHFFYRKGFLRHASKSLSEAKKLSISYEKTETTLKIMAEELRLSMEIETNQLESKIAELVKEKEEWLRVLEGEGRAKKEYYKLFAEFRAKGVLNEPREIPFPDPSKGRQSFTVMHFRNNANVIQSRMNMDFPETENHLRKLVGVWRAQEQVKEEYLSNYKKILGNFATILISNGKWTESLEIIKELEELPSRNFKDRAETFQAVAQARLLLALNGGQDYSVSTLVTYLNEGLKKFETEITLARRLSLWHNTFLVCLYEKEIETARIWMQEIINHKKYQLKKQDHYVIRLCGPLLEYDAKDYDDLEDTINATYVYFQRNKYHDDLCQAVFRFVRSVLKNVSGDHTHYLGQFEEDLNRIEPDSLQEATPGFQAVAGWVSKRISSVLPTQNLHHTMETSSS